MWRPHVKRDKLASLLAITTAACLAVVFVVSSGTRFLMPGPLTSAHGSIESCSSCHTNSGSGKLSWVKGLVAGDPHADSKACLTCHKMPDTAFNAHGASEAVLQASTERLMSIGLKTPAPTSAVVQNIAFPAHDVAARGLTCATCHQEHQGENFKLNRIANEQCRSCHVVKFDSFDGNHPAFDSYPFKMRTRIVYDHAGHFGKHYPELAKKDPTRRIPDTCASCHNTSADRRVMGVAPFEKTCSGCHLDQIVGKERATGPKGIAFLAVPGLDLVTLKAKNAAIGDWPDASEAALTPFMKVMISRSERGRALLQTVSGLNLQDLGKASDDQIKAVTSLAWEIKGLFHALIKGKASDVLGDLNISGGAKLSPGLVTDLTASIPRDVVQSAQQEWLPNLAAEMANRPEPGAAKQSAVRDDAPSPVSPAPKAVPPANGTGSKPSGDSAPRSTGALPPPMRAGVGDPDKAAKQDEADNAEDGGHGEAVKGRSQLPSGTPRSIRTRNEKKSEPAKSKSESGKDKPAATAPSGDADKPGAAPAAQPDAAAGKADAPPAVAGASAEPPASSAPGDQSDDLLHPTEAELREMKAGGSGKADAPVAAGSAAPASGKPEATPATAATPEAPAAPAASSAPAKSSTAAAGSPLSRAPVISIGSDVDPESWAEYGGWYRQDFAIFYRPTGHKDKFIYSWLFLTGPQAPKDAKSPAASVFDVLTGKDAQGSCSKCHSIDGAPAKGRMVNFSPLTVVGKKGQFTAFVHEPHFGVMENRGCLTCHTLEKDRPYLKSYEQGNPLQFASNFGAVKKDLCQGCHTDNKARQDCLLCHAYHVNGVTTPIINTKLPLQ